MLKGNTFKINVATEIWYRKKIKSLVKKMVQETIKELIPEYKDLNYQISF